MERITTRLPAGLLESIDAAIDDGEYATRSDAVRAALRQEFRDRRGSKRPQRRRSQ